MTANLPLPRCLVSRPPVTPGGELGPRDIAAWNTGTYAAAVMRFGFDVELRPYQARGLTQGMLMVSKPGVVGPTLVRVELDPETQTLRGVWDRSVVVLYGSQLNALTGMVRRNLRRLRDHAARRDPQTVAEQEAFLVRLLEALADAGANNRYDEQAPPERALHAVPDFKEH